ncbi:hypothetical protein [Aliiglaciecola sp. LCG003]|uniref:hypothetical protein n=1 Tax=Aliiglaciecola sp. LCG003 TaxID=3053655 RepID=UPI0025745FE6|nr:hypothetical protein [Aliiglaciecola sp. LCG003]WJG10662.1 hypothetical protein QR722_06365 [Aliiglaciecola sp. LCG003]
MRFLVAIIGVLFYVQTIKVWADNSLIDGLDLYSDSALVTESINSKSRNISTGIDTLQLLFDRLLLDVNLLNVPFSRSLNYIDKGQSACVVSKIKTPERETKYLFTHALNFFETQKLYQLGELPPIAPELLNSSGEVKDIHSVLNAMPSSTILLPRDYSFGSRVDIDLAKVNKEQIIPIANSDFYDSFMRIWTAKRTDFALIYPVRLYKHFKQDNPIEMRSYDIATNPKFVTGHILCGDSPKGRAFIDAVNQAIIAMYSEPSFITAHTSYLPPQSAQAISGIIQSHKEQILLANQ